MKGYKKRHIKNGLPNIPLMKESIGFHLVLLILEIMTRIPTKFLKIDVVHFFIEYLVSSYLFQTH
jgi:hypothetical protein